MSNVTRHWPWYFRTVLGCATALVACAVTPVSAQDGVDGLAPLFANQSQVYPTTPNAAVNAEVGRTADSPVGRVGQRQLPADARRMESIVRIENRISNRIQSRIRNRIDRNYNPQANASSSFEVAEEQVREPH